jgi:hypothetical protein
MGSSPRPSPPTKLVLPREEREKTMAHRFVVTMGILRYDSGRESANDRSRIEPMERQLVVARKTEMEPPYVGCYGV